MKIESDKRASDQYRKTITTIPETNDKNEMLDRNDKFTRLHATIGHDDGIKQDVFHEQDLHYDNGNVKDMNAMNERARRRSLRY